MKIRVISPEMKRGIILALPSAIIFSSPSEKLFLFFISRSKRHKSSVQDDADIEKCIDTSKNKSKEESSSYSDKLRSEHSIPAAKEKFDFLTGLDQKTAAKLFAEIRKFRRKHKRFTLIDISLADGTRIKVTR